MPDYMEKKPKIALMSYAMDNRAGKGTALYTRKLIERMLDDDRFEWYLVHFDRIDDPIYRRAHEIVMPELKLPFATRFVRTMLFFWKYRNEKFDIIHWFQPRLYPFFWLVPARTIVVTAHGAGDITAIGKFPFSRRIFNFVFKHFNSYIDAIIGVSEFGRREIIEFYGASPERVHAIYNGGGEAFLVLDKERSRLQIAQRYGIDSRFILDISRLQPHKNVDSLISAYDLMRRGHPERTEKLVIVGWPTFKYERTYALARESAFSKDIVFIEHVEQEDINMVYCAAELFVFPSLNEGFGLPVIEAFASGTPVVTSDVTSLPEVAGDAALVVRPLDVSAVAQAMQRILGDPLLRADLVERGKKRAAEFTWEKTAAQTTELYCTLLA